MASVRECALALSLTLIAGRAHPQELVNAYPDLSFAKPVFLTSAGDGTDRVFVVQQTGVIVVFPNDSLAASTTTFLDVSTKLSSSGGEEGLLGLAFHPDYARNGYFYVDYTAPNPLRTVVARFKVSGGNPDKVDSLSEFAIIEIPQPYSNHNGGMLAFGPDGYLYIGMGDGGSGGDPQNNAQDRTRLLGKILRIDVNDTTATEHYVIPPDNPYANDTGGLRREIWAYGFRNPWRFSFDTASGALWAADVGQNAVEEIDIVRKGRNYGWRIMEGTRCYSPPSGCDTTGLAIPIKEYYHPTGEAITGGYVYHGYRRPDLAGAYIYADYITGLIWMLRYAGGLVIADSLVTQTSSLISSFGTDRDQELYIVTYSGSGGRSGIYRFSGSLRPETPQSFSLGQNHPNPFSSSTKIPFELKKPADVLLRILDARGRLVRVLDTGRNPAGKFERSWDGTDTRGAAVASGVYFCRLETEGYTQTIKMVLMK
jgi:glucose/arabinose dehydrogenase